MKREKFIIKDILTNKKKLDRRFYLVQRFKQFIAALVLGAIFGALFGCYISSGGSISIGYPNALEQPIEVKAVEVTKQRYCGDPQAYLRCKAQDLGIDDFVTSKIINMISSCENKKWNPEAINVNTDKYRSLDVGIMQINLHWHPDVTLTEMVDYKKNIDYGLKMFLKQGFEPWTCAHKLGYVK